MSETQLEVNGVTYSGKDLDLICLGMSLKEESIIKLLEEASKPKCDSEACNCWDIQGLEEAIELIKGEK